jgi:hypothetical protein
MIIKVSGYCIDCDNIRLLETNGRCANCGSNSIYEIYMDNSNHFENISDIRRMLSDLKAAINYNNQALDESHVDMPTEKLIKWYLYNAEREMEKANEAMKRIKNRMANTNE